MQARLPRKRVVSAAVAVAAAIAPPAVPVPPAPPAVPGLPLSPKTLAMLAAAAEKAKKKTEWEAKQKAKASVLGTWDYGEGDLYVIKQVDGKLTFTEGETSGQLHPDGEFLVATLRSVTGAIAGFMRIRPKDGKVISNCKAEASAPWDDVDDVVATKVKAAEVPPAPDARPVAPAEEKPLSFPDLVAAKAETADQVQSSAVLPAKALAANNVDENEHESAQEPEKEEAVQAASMRRQLPTLLGHLRPAPLMLPPTAASSLKTMPFARHHGRA